MKLYIAIMMLLFPNLIFNNVVSNIKNTSKIESSKITGVWETKKKDLTVLVSEEKGTYSAKLVAFTCNCVVKTSMDDHKDTKNPDPKCRNNSWTNTKIMWGLKLKKEDVWTNGYVYDLTSGTTYAATVTRLTNDKIEVRGYWGFEFIGKSLYFYRQK